MALLSERNIKRAEKVAIKLILNRSQFITFLRVCVFVYRLGVGEGGTATGEVKYGGLHTSSVGKSYWPAASCDEWSVSGGRWGAHFQTSFWIMGWCMRTEQIKFHRSHMVPNQWRGRLRDSKPPMGSSSHQCVPLVRQLEAGGAGATSPHWSFALKWGTECAVCLSGTNHRRQENDWMVHFDGKMAPQGFSATTRTPGSFLHTLHP